MSTDTQWYDPETTTFGDRLAGAREAMGMEQNDLAQRLGVRLETVEDWENDVSEPRSNRLSTMSGILNVSLPWLLMGAGEGPAGNDAGLPVAQLRREIRDTRAQLAGAMDRLGRLEDILEAVDGRADG